MSLLKRNSIPLPGAVSGEEEAWELLMRRDDLKSFDDLLARRSSLTRKINVLENKTLLMAAVQMPYAYELVAILLYHGADPLQRRNGASDWSAFDMLFSLPPPIEDTVGFHFLATLLNNGISPEGSGGARERMDRHLFGSHVDAPLRDFDPNYYVEHDLTEIPDPWQTALMYACEQGYPYCARYLIEKRGYNVHIKNNEGLDAMCFAMSSFERNVLSGPDERGLYGPNMDRDIALAVYQHLFKILLDAGANPWRRFRKAWEFCNQISSSEESTRKIRGMR